MLQTNNGKIIDTESIVKSTSDIDSLHDPAAFVSVHRLFVHSFDAVVSWIADERAAARVFRPVTGSWRGVTPAGCQRVALPSRQRV